MSKIYSDSILEPAAQVAIKSGTKPSRNIIVFKAGVESWTFDLNPLRLLLKTAQLAVIYNSKLTHREYPIGQWWPTCINFGQKGPFVTAMTTYRLRTGPVSSGALCDSRVNKGSIGSSDVCNFNSPGSSAPSVFPSSISAPSPFIRLGCEFPHVLGIFCQRLWNSVSHIIHLSHTPSMKPMEPNPKSCPPWKKITCSH